ncbi:MAG: hypothetical protein IT289_09900 [Oligoflexia bacterium]|nr:hypothetical protein [Oligoflexia bacterium]
MKVQLLVILSVFFGLVNFSQANEPAKAVCVVHHLHYAGNYCTAETEIGANESIESACRAVEKCLNDVRCIKTYCNATTIRGGWTLVGYIATTEQDR